MTSRRIVLLTTSETSVPDAAGTAPEGAEYVPVETGYEAAAEILSGGVSALVVHLPSLHRQQVRLLEIARGRNVPMMGIGGFPQELTTDDLDGMQLVSAGQLHAALERSGR